MIELILNISILGLAAIVLLIWIDTYENFIERKWMERHLLMTVILIVTAVTARTLWKLNFYPEWMEAVMLISTVLAAVFWLQTSHDIREGRF